MKALIAEDDKVSSKVLASILAPYFDCVAHEDGESAFNAFCDAFDADERFDLVMLDIMMPLADGQEVLEAIRTYEGDSGIPLGRGVKVVMVSALDDGMNLYQAHASGCTEYLVKPIQRDEVLRTLRRIGLEHIAPPKQSPKQEESDSENGEASGSE